MKENGGMGNGQKKQQRNSPFSTKFDVVDTAAWGEKEKGKGQILALLSCK